MDLSDRAAPEPGRSKGGSLSQSSGRGNQCPHRGRYGVGLAELRPRARTADAAIAGDAVRANIRSWIQVTNRMRLRTWPNILAVTVLWTAVISTALVSSRFVSSARAEEPFESFLEALRRREMFDVALSYLEVMQDSPLLTVSQRETIALEAGRTLVQGASRINDFELRMEQLDLARDRFTEFISEYPSHQEVGTARMELGNVLVARGRTQLERAKRPSNSARKDDLEQEAKSLFDEARTVFEGAEKDFADQVASYPQTIDREQTELIAARKRATNNQMQSQLLLGQVLFEMAAAEADASQRREELLDNAAEKFAEVYEKNRIVFGGLIARIWQGRCFQEKGETKQALAYYSDLLSQPDGEQKFRTLKSQALRLSMICWASESQRKYDESISRGEAWLRSARGSEAVTPDGIAIRWLTAEALLARAGQPDTAAGQAAQDRAAAEAHIETVAKYPGEYRQTAKDKLAQLQNRDPDGDPTNFDEALTLGQTVLMELEAAGSAAGDASKIETLRDEAIASFERTMSLRDAETKIEDVNQVRYYLCYLYFQAGRYYDAAVLGEFLARRYPESGGARPCAKIAMYSYLQSYNSAPPSERDFDTKQMVSIAEYLAEQWPDQPEADDAWMKLGTISVRSGALDEAIAFFDRVPDDSPMRSRADLQAGQAVWSRYLRSLSDPSSGTDGDALASRAAELLDRGLAKADQGAGDDARLRAAGELARAQIHVRNGEFDGAIALLDSEGKGLLTQTAQGKGAAARAEFGIEVYKTALRAYVGAERFDEAEATIDQLIALAEKSGASGDTVTRVLVRLGRDLETQVADLQAANRIADRNRVLTALSTFLDKISGRQDGGTYATLLWVAETYTGIGSGLVSQGAPRLEAKPYFNKAVDVYQKILSRAAADAEFMPAADRTSIEVRLARCERLSEQYEKSVDRLVTILKRRPSTIDAQVEAASAYQDWGRIRSENYLSAIRGARRARKKDGTTTRIVWGWAKISAVLQNNANFREVYHEARFHLAECYYQYAQSKSGDAKKKALEQAGVAIRATARLFPELGGPSWASKYDTLLKQIQREQGAEPVGLETAQAAARTGG